MVEIILVRSAVDTIRKKKDVFDLRNKVVHVILFFCLVCVIKWFDICHHLILTPLFMHDELVDSNKIYGDGLMMKYEVIP